MSSSLHDQLNTPTVESLVARADKIGILSNNKQRRLIRKYQETGDSEALECLILCNIKFVISVAKRYIGLNVPMEDLVMSGIMGMVTAAGRFNLDRTQFKVKFISYAVWWVDQTIRVTVNREGSLVRLPTNRWQEIAKLKKKHGKEEAMRMLSDTDPALVSATLPSISLHKPVSEQDGSPELQDVLVAPEEEDHPLHTTQVESLKRMLDELMGNCLTDQERQVLDLRFNLINDETKDPLTLEGVGKIIGVTRERVRQIEKQALTKLRRNLKQRGVDKLEAVA